MDVLGPDANVDETFWGRVFDAQSKGVASKKTDYPVTHEFVAWEYTRHSDGSLSGGRAVDGVDVLPTGAVRIRQKANLERGLSTTRFHQGFQRRKQSHIRQDEDRLEREARKQRVSSIHLHRRRQRLGSLDKRNGFNLITGQFDPANRRCTTPFHVPPRMRECGPLSEGAERTEYLLLRDSKYKFHAPAWSGKNHDQRQDLLQREGLNKPKKSTLLGLGSADLASAGVEDMFSKAIYDPAKACAVEGLVEASIPGRYTPRKIAARTVPAASPAAAAHSAPPFGKPRDGRNPSPTGASGTVFRILPTGLGSSTAPGRVGAFVPGIAPAKRFNGSRSAPALSRESTAGKKLVAYLGTAPPSIRSRSPGRGGSSGRATDRGRRGCGPESSACADVPSADNGALDPAKESSREGSGNHSHTGSGGRSRVLSRSQSDSGYRSSGDNACGSGTAGAGFLHRCASEDRVVRSSARGDLMGSGGSRSAQSTGASPAQRRKDNQLALDFAAVRSLDA